MWPRAHAYARFARRELRGYTATTRDALEMDRVVPIGAGGHDGVWRHSEGDCCSRALRGWQRFAQRLAQQHEMQESQRSVNAALELNGAMTVPLRSEPRWAGYGKLLGVPLTLEEARKREGQKARKKGALTLIQFFLPLSKCGSGAYRHIGGGDCGVPTSLPPICPDP